MRAILFADLAAVKQRLDVDARERSRDESEQRHHRVAPADVRRVEECVAQAIIACELL